MSPSAVSAIRCWGCQPVRGPTEVDCSREHRKPCDTNGLSTCPRVENSVEDAAQASQSAAGTSASDDAMRMWSSTVIGALLAPVYARNRKSGPAFCSTAACSAAADVVDPCRIAVPVEHRALDVAV